MIPNYGYQLYQAQRTMTRAEILADDARLGRRAAAVFRGSRALAGQAGAPGIMALNAIRAIAAQVTARAHDGGRAGSPTSRDLTPPDTRKPPETAMRGLRDHHHRSRRGPGGTAGIARSRPA